MFSFLSFLKRKKKAEDFDQGWNSCLDELQEVLGKHQWAVDAEDPQEIFCDVCGQRMVRILEDMRK